MSRKALFDFARPLAPGGQLTPAMVSAGEQEVLLQRELPLVASLAKLDRGSVTISSELAAPDKAVTIASSGVTIAVSSSTVSKARNALSSRSSSRT